MKKFLIKYYFEGFGKLKVEAKNKKEANEKFIYGNYNEEDEEEWGENYSIEETEEI